MGLRKRQKVGPSADGLGAYPPQKRQIKRQLSRHFEFRFSILPALILESPSNYICSFRFGTALCDVILRITRWTLIGFRLHPCIQTKLTYLRTHRVPIRLPRRLLYRNRIWDVSSFFQKHNISFVSVVVCNLYPFKKTVQSVGCSLEDAVENIDIGKCFPARRSGKLPFSLCFMLPSASSFFFWFRFMHLTCFNPWFASERRRAPNNILLEAADSCEMSLPCFRSHSAKY